ncbi:MAG TPA: formate dehydrogenase subunit gamma [Rhizobacter sp.]|nr:formate dehydrogenase subunit gamma [Rhizobacter sp.]
MTRYIRRYEDSTRMNHWAVALLFLCAGLSGLSIFHPSLFFFSALFGGGPWTRILHPFFGVLMVLGFIGLFATMWRDNLLDSGDREWLRHAGELLAGHEENMPPVDKYNAGQKLVFWVSALCLLVLVVTGFMFWRPWFADAFPIPVRRIAVLLHAIAAVVLILTIIVHVYAAIWVSGSMRAMTRGTVTDAWARQHHRLWHRETTQRE